MQSLLGIRIHYTNGKALQLTANLRRISLGQFKVAPSSCPSFLSLTYTQFLRSQLSSFDCITPQTGDVKCSLQRSIHSQINGNGMHLDRAGRTEREDGALSKDEHEITFTSMAASALVESPEIDRQYLAFPGWYGSCTGSSMSFPTKSDILIAALGSVAPEYSVPEKFSHKLDLSYVSPVSIASSGRRPSDKKKPSTLSVNKHERTVLLRFRRSIKSLFIFYMTYVKPGVEIPTDNRSRPAEDLLNQDLLYLCDNENLAYLKEKGYEITDFATWSWILTASSPELAATRLAAVTKCHNHRMQSRSVPIFVYLFLLRRQNFNVRALKTLLDYGWNWLSDPQHVEGTPVSVSGSSVNLLDAVPKFTYDQKRDESIIILMVVRLLRHARVVWPAAFLSISAMVTKHIGCNERTASFSGEGTARLTFIYNTILSLLSLPSSSLPFKSVIYHQQAQFHVLRRMHEFQPALIIDRGGYRAIASVQIAHKKTLREREWADMKAKSWPPWKEEKLGIESDIGIEHGISRASESISRSEEAGYAAQNWEEVAQVLAGWDTDRSPTIQSRAIAQRAILPRSESLVNETHSLIENKTELWAARIRATRTLPEAWACFLSYKAQRIEQDPHEIYFAMFEKFTFEDKRRRAEEASVHQEPIKYRDDTIQSLPGDGKEVSPNPGPQEAIYVRTPPPSTDGFFEMMTDDGIEPSGKFLGFILSRARSLRSGARYLEASQLSNETLETLLGQEIFQGHQSSAKLKEINVELFASIIRFLSRFGHFVKSYQSPRYSQLKKSRIRSGLLHTNPLKRAIRLVALREPFYRPPWNSLFSALAKPGIFVNGAIHRSSVTVQDMLAWSAVCRILQQMEKIGLDIDFAGFHHLCTCLEKAVLASQALIRLTKVSDFKLDECYDDKGDPHENSRTSLSYRIEAESVLSDGTRTLGKYFGRLVGFGTDLENLPSQEHQGPECETQANIRDPSTLLPRLLEVPHPSHLHAFIRVLGLQGDYNGLLGLVRWMRQFNMELESDAAESMNGKKLLRRCIIAVRVFLERSWLFLDGEASYSALADRGGVDDEAPEEIWQKVFKLVETQESWGGWPTDEDVEEYCRKGRFSY